MLGVEGLGVSGFAFRVWALRYPKGVPPRLPLRGSFLCLFLGSFKGHCRGLVRFSTDFWL